MSLGKYGSFPANCLLGRPYNLTYEILDRQPGQSHSSLRVVPAAEVHADVLSEGQSTTPELGDVKVIDGGDGVEYELVGEDGEVVMRSNRGTIDDPTRQKMTMDEIEVLKKEGTRAGKDLIARLLLSHSALDQKTTFALAKYTLRKTKKYMRRFTVLPLDVPTLTDWLLAERLPAKVMELRQEMLALIGSWANVHYSGADIACTSDKGQTAAGGGRWLVIDETGGLVMAAVAERMGVLYSKDSSIPPTSDGEADASLPAKTHPYPHHEIPAMSASTNTITMLHSNAQANLALLKYFDYDISNPSPTHPLYTHLKTLSWLQLLFPEEDLAYAEPELVSDEVLRTWKSSKRGTYYRKRRRWERTRLVVDETRRGGFDGLIVASPMNPLGLLRHTIPLLRGGAAVAVYSPAVEPLVEIADLYSTSRRAAFVTTRPDPASLPSDDFPLDPTLLLAPTVQTARLKPWQCLPGRTHPLMTGRGGAEGYLFTATRVLPAEGKVEARGKFKRRKVTKENVNGNNGGDAEASLAPAEVEESPRPEVVKAKDVSGEHVPLPS